MRLWRITTRKWALDRLCEGARRDGGRWNPVGTPVMYAGTSIAICALEKFVHLAGPLHPPLVLVSIDVPVDSKLFFTPSFASLPSDWSNLSDLSSAQVFGQKWVDAVSHLVMLVPSAIIPECLNAAINPAHPKFAKVKLDIVRDFTFDARMFKPDLSR